MIWKKYIIPKDMQSSETDFDPKLKNVWYLVFEIATVRFWTQCSEINAKRLGMVSYPNSDVVVRSREWIKCLQFQKNFEGYNVV